jgi:hypothetical protein
MITGSFTGDQEVRSTGNLELRSEEKEFSWSLDLL